MTYRNADTRIREAFAALRAEIEGVFGEQPDLSDVPTLQRVKATPPAYVVNRLHCFEKDILDFAKQPASEGAR